MNIFYKITILLFAQGVTAALAQIILSREITNQVLLTNDIIGFTILSWVFGAILAFQTIKKIAAGKAPEKKLNFIAAIVPVINAFYITGMVILVRYFKPVLTLGPDVNAPDWTALAMLGIVFVPIAFMIFISIFSLVEALKKGKVQQFVFTAIAAVVAGIVAAIIFYTLWAVKYYINIDVVYTLGVFNLAIAYLFFRDKTMEGRWLMLIIIGTLIIYLGFNIAGMKQKVDEASSRALFKNFTIIAQKEYPTVNFCLVKKGEETLAYENGTLAYILGDKKFKIIASPAKGPRVLVINGGLAGMTEALSNNKSVKEIVCVEADPYIAFVLSKMYGNFKTKNKLEYISAQNTSGIAMAIKDKGLFNTIIIIPRLQGHIEGKYYASAEFLNAVNKMLEKDGQIIYGGINEKK